ncbi:hypothetical protein V6N11_010738 [Hibiscus sabdariffa]|uniref:Uncharacterized protein n=1 Tax=Hibiscus sabdariffa TaxID=183260 RepID=A0ABR2S6S5_9ROSI
MSNPGSLQALTMAPSSAGVVNGRPPDEIIVDETMVLDRPRSPLLEDAQRQAKKGCSSDNNVLQQTNISSDLGIGTAIAAAHIPKQSGSRFTALSDDAVGAMLREQDGPVGSILNQAAGGMASGILNANHGINKGDTRRELSISDLPHVTSHDGNAKEQSVKVASKDKIVSGTTTLNKEFHTVVRFENTDDVHSKTGRMNHVKHVGSTISSSKGGAKGSLRVSTVQKVSSKGRKKDNKAVVPVTVSDRMSSLRTDLNRVAMDIGQEDDGATVLGDASEAVVQWSDNVTYDSQIRDDMLA